MKHVRKPAYGAFSRLLWKGNPFLDASRDARHATDGQPRGSSTEKPQVEKSGCTDEAAEKWTGSE